jgi:hypothetical protein
MSGCAYLQKKDEPPPLPPIEETKPPLKMSADYFREYPWTELGKASKDSNEPDTRPYTFKDGDSFGSIADKEMGDPAMGPKLAAYNNVSEASTPAPGEKIIIPNPIIGINSQMVVKRKGEREFGSPESVDVTIGKGDEYKLRFESNVNGFLYVFRQGTKGVELLYPAQVKTSTRTKKKQSEPLMRDTGKVTAHDPVVIPTGGKGFSFDPKRVGDRVFVFLSLRQIPEFEDLKDKGKIKIEEVEDVMHRVKEGEIVTDGGIRVLRISDPSEVLGFSLNING